MSDIYFRLLETIQTELADELPRDRAIEISAAAVSRVCEAVGGQRVYLPRRSPWISSDLRDHAIRRVYNGRNMREVCEHFQVSERTVYRAIKTGK